MSMMNAKSLNSSAFSNESVEGISDFSSIESLTDNHDNNVSIQFLYTPPPILEFVMHVNRKVCHLTESTLPASVFRAHLKLAKNEENVLVKLRSDTSTFPSTDNLHLTVADGLDACSIPDKTEQLQVASVELSEENIFSSQDVISIPEVLQTEKVLVCVNATLPVLSFTNESYYLSTVIEDPMRFTKVARLEVVCDFHEANLLSRSLKNPFLHAMEPGSIIQLHDPIFKYNSSGETIIHVNKIKDVVFHGHVSPFILKMNNMFQSEINSEWETKISTPLTNENSEEICRLEDKSTASFLASSSTGERKYASDEWKDWGNKNSVLRKHSQALIAYKIALRFDPMNIELVSAKCASLVNLGLFTSALKEVDSIITQNPFNTRLILRKTHCLWGLGLYHEAIDYLKHTHEKLSMKSIKSQYTEKECAHKRMFIQNIISKTQKIIAQSETPELQDGFVACQNQAQMSYIEPEYYDPISLIFKNINVNESNSNCKRKIAIANREVPAGMLLAKTKAFSVVFQEDSTDSLNDDLMNLTMLKLLYEKSTEIQLDDLGEKESFSNEPQANRSKSEITKFCEKYLYESNNGHFAELPPENEQSNETDDEASASPSIRTPIITVRGLWRFPANIRHACVGGNAIWYISGNYMFIRAVCDIKDGEEILMAHVEPTKSFQFRQQFLNKKGMTCSCSLCQFEKTEPETTKMRMDQLLNTIKEINENLCSKDICSLQLRRLKHCLDDLEILRGAYARLNFPIVEPFYNYGFYLTKTGSFDEAIVALEKAFFVVDNTAAIFSLVNISFLLSYCYVAKKKNSDKHRSRKWFAAAESYAELSYGSLNPVKHKFKLEFEYLKSKNIILQ